MCRYLLKVIHVHLDLRKVLTTSIWNDQQSFTFIICMLLSLSILFSVCQISIYFIELQYNCIYNLLYYYRLKYTI